MDAWHWEVLCPRSAILIEINTRKTAWKRPKDSESDKNYSTNWRHRSARAKHWSHDPAVWLARLCMFVSLHFMTGDIAYPTFRCYHRWHWGMYATLAKKRFAQVRRRDIWFAAPLKFFLPPSVLSQGMDATSLRSTSTIRSMAICMTNFVSSVTCSDSTWMRPTTWKGTWQSSKRTPSWNGFLCVQRGFQAVWKICRMPSF